MSIDNETKQYHDQIEQYLNDILDYKDMETKKLKLLVVEIEKLKNYKQYLQLLNITLNEYMYETKNSNLVLDNQTYQEQMNSFSNDTLTIYVPKAQLFKVYLPANLNEFENDRVWRQKAENGPVHEVVRDAHPQKLLIVFNSLLTESQISTVKNYIVPFIQRNPAFEKFKSSDITVFTIDSKTEFFIKSLTLENIIEKDKMTESFLKVLYKSNNKELMDLIQLIQLRQPICPDLEGARFYRLPGDKVAIGNPKINISEYLISILPSKLPSQQILLTINVNNNNNNISNVGVPLADKRTLKSFFKHIYDTKPDWYVENGKISIKTIENYYREYFDDYAIIAPMISRILNGKLFNTISKAQRTHLKQLVSYNDLKQLYQ